MAGINIITLALAKKFSKSQSNNISSLSPFQYKGSVNNYYSLPLSATKGDMYTTSDTTDEYLWSGTEWIKLGNDSNFQDKLVSGTNIKTINGESILGNGNINIEQNEQVQSDWDETDSSKKDYIKNKIEKINNNDFDYLIGCEIDSFVLDSNILMYDNTIDCFSLDFDTL